MRTWIISSLLLCFVAVGAYGQQSQPAAKKETATWRTVGTAAGAGGGFVVGLLIGLSKYDDAINSDRKVWTAALVGAAAGAVGGYFAGRAVDKHNAIAWKLDPMDRSLLHAQQALVVQGSEKVQCR